MRPSDGAPPFFGIEENPTMRRIALYAPLAAAAFMAASLAASAQQPPAAAQLVPAGRTLSYAEVSSFSQAEAALKSTDLGQAWDALHPFVDNLRKGLDAQLAEQKGQFEQEFGVKADDVIALLEGGFSLAVVDTAPAGGEPQPVPVVVFPASAKATVAQLAEALKQKQGQQAPPLHVMDRPGACCVTLDQNALLAANGGAGGPSLAQDASFQATRGKIFAQGTPVFFAYFDIGATIERAVKGDPREMIEKLGLAGTKAAGIGLSAEGGRIREALAVLMPGERKGVAKMLMFGKPLELAKLGDRAPADCMSFSAMRLDLRALFDQAVDLAHVLDPNGPQDADQEVARMLEGFEQNFGLKLKEDLLDALGDVVTTETMVPEDGLLPEMVFTLDVKDATKLQRAIATLADRAGFQVASVERGGRRISYLQAPLGKIGEDPTRGMSQDQMTAQGIMVALMGAWTVDQGRVYFAAMPQAIEERFERMSKGSLAENEGFKKAIATAPAGTRSFGWSRTRGTMGVAYHLVLKGLRAVEPMARRAGLAVDTALLPRPQAVAQGFRPSTSAFVADADGFMLVSQGGFPVLSVLPVLGAAGALGMAKRSGGGGGGEQVEFDLRMLAYAEQSYRMDKGQYTANLQDLIAGGQVDPSFQSRLARSGYQVRIETQDQAHFAIAALPTKPGKAALMIDESMEVRPYGAKPRRPATPEPDEGAMPVPEGGGEPTGGMQSGGARPFAGDDDAHKLYQAAAMTGDQQVILGCLKKLGFMNEDGSMKDADAYQKFAMEHGDWAQSRISFIQELSGPGKAKEYWEAHK
jgi:hypothetical protein